MHSHTREEKERGEGERARERLRGREREEGDRRDGGQKNVLALHSHKQHSERLLME